MKPILLSFLAAVLTTGGLLGCVDNGLSSNPTDNNVRVTGSGKLITREMDFAGFNKIEVGSVFNITLPIVV